MRLRKLNQLIPGPWFRIRFTKCVVMMVSTIALFSIGRTASMGSGEAQQTCPGPVAALCEFPVIWVCWDRIQIGGSSFTDLCMNSCKTNFNNTTFVIEESLLDENCKFRTSHQLNRKVRKNWWNHKNEHLMYWPAMWPCCEKKIQKFLNYNIKIVEIWFLEFETWNHKTVIKFLNLCNPPTSLLLECITFC